MKQQRNLSYASPFSAEYWRSALHNLRDLRLLTLAALLVALRVVVSGFYIPLGDNLNVFFSFLVSSLGCVIYGPIIGLLAGFASDIIGVMIHPMGAFFFGYTLSTMLAYFVFGLLFYRRPLTLARLAAAKLIINLGINVALGSLWSAILYSKGYYYYLLRGLTKNVLLWPVEVALMYVFFRAILPQTHRLGLTVQKTVSLRKNKQE